MKPQTDPVVQNLNEWINRSAGQHQRRISEGTESAARLLRLPVVGAMTADRLNLHRVDTSQLGERDGVSIGACCTGDCSQGRDCPERESGELSPLTTVVLYLVVAVLLVAALFATAPELVLMLMGLI